MCLKYSKAFVILRGCCCSLEQEKGDEREGLELAFASLSESLSPGSFVVFLTASK
jgi:hypothetical protein